MRKIFQVFFVAAIGMFLFSSLGHAQLYQAKIDGQVTDPSGARIPGATVIATNTNTGVQVQIQTTPDGNYVLPPINPGTYTLTVKAKGFKEYVQAGVTVSVGQELRLNFPLQLGAATQRVTVTAAPPMLTTTNADNSQIFTRSYIEKLYVPYRNPINLVMLAPGVSLTTGYADTKFSNTGYSSTGINAGMSINGGGSTTGANSVTVDGVSVTVPNGLGGLVSMPSSDALSEFAVKTTNFDASLGHTNGGTIAMATRAGTNQFHGSFEGYYGSQGLNANSWFNNRNGIDKTPVTRRFYSGVIGGPIQRDKMFFFVSGERDTDHAPYSELWRVPTADERQGDFSKTLSPAGTPLEIYDPLTTVVNGSTATRQAFPGATIPADRIDPMGAAVLNVYPMPNLDVAPQIGKPNWAQSYTVPDAANQWSARIDRTLTSHQRIFGRFSFLNQSSQCEGCPKGLYDAPGISSQKGINIMLNHAITLSNTFLASVSYSFSRAFTSLSYSANGLDPKQLNVPSIVVNNALNKAWPRVFIGYPAEGIDPIYQRLVARTNNTFQIVPAFTKLWGNHTLKFGADMRYVQWGQTISNGGAGEFDFNNTFTRSDPFASATGETSGTAMASLLLGVPSGGGLSYGPAPFLSSKYTALYLQDTWKVTSKLTITPGVRWEVEVPYVERHDQLVHTFDPNVALPVQVPGYTLRGGLLLAGVNGNPRTDGNTDWNNVAPRFGFAYHLRPHTVIRGGYGIFFNSEVYGQNNNLPTGNIYGPDTSIIGSVDGGATPYATTQNPFPQGLNFGPGNSIGVMADVGDNIGSRFWAQNMVAPYNQQWSLSIQQQLGANSLLEVAYVHELNLKGLIGAKAGDATTHFNQNELPDKYLSLQTDLYTRVDNPFYGYLSPTSTLGASPTVTRQQLLLPYPQFTSIDYYGNVNTANYNALQIQFNKRLSHGLTFMFNNTWAKTLSANVESVVNPDRNIYGISGLDRADTLSIASVYELPFGKGKYFLSGAGRGKEILVGGWTVSGMYHFASGMPLSFSDSNGRPNVTCNPSKSGPIEGRLNDYFNTSCFASLPNQFTVPTSPVFVSHVRAPSFSTFDMAVWKSFTAWERLHFQVRGEASNLLNTPNFAAPGTNLANKGTFGVIQNAGAPRVIQLAFRVVF